MRSLTHFLRHLTVISLKLAMPEDDSENKSKHVAQILPSYYNCIIVKHIVALTVLFSYFMIRGSA
jgi:hypothetical protein